MTKYHFSFNIDKYISNNIEKVFSIIVSYFGPEIGELVVQHYESASMIEVHS